MQRRFSENKQIKKLLFKFVIDRHNYLTFFSTCLQALIFSTRASPPRLIGQLKFSKKESYSSKNHKKFKKEKTEMKKIQKISCFY